MVRRILLGRLCSATGASAHDRVAAYDDTMKIMVIAATVLSVVPVCLALAMPNWYLGDQQNAVDAADLSGRPALEDDAEDDGES